MEGIRGLRGWQWMFLLEGLPNIPLGVITYLFLANIPATVQCKTLQKEYEIFLRVF
jgi:hypothetical protein